MTPLEWLIATAIVLFCAVVQGSIGFGLGVLGAPLLFLVNPQLVPGPVVMVGMLLPMMIFARDWRAVTLRDIAWVLPGMAVGIALGAGLLAVVSPRGLSLLFGALVLFATGLSVHGPALRLSRPNLLAGGWLSGFMGATVAIGGPPLALLFQHLRGSRLRGTLSAIFIPGGIATLAALHAFGHFGLPELLAGASLMPAIIAGFWLSAFTIAAMERQWLRPALLAVSATAGVMAILRGLLGF